jgi:hypothetical protein
VQRNSAVIEAYLGREEAADDILAIEERAS